MCRSCNKTDRVTRFFTLLDNKLRRERRKLDYNISRIKLGKIFEKQWMGVLYDIFPEDKKFLENPNYVKFSVVDEEYQYIFDNKYFYNKMELLYYIYDTYPNFGNKFVKIQSLVRSNTLENPMGN